jgi:hypothetical protein
MISRRLACVAAAAVAITASLAGSAQASAPQDDGGNSGLYFCVSSSLPAQCAALKNDDFTLNQPVIMTNSATGEGLGWNLDLEGKVSSTSPFPEGGNMLNDRYHGDDEYIIEKTTSTGHDGCMGAVQNPAPDANTYYVAWMPCNLGNPVLWVESESNYWINVQTSSSYDQPWGMSDSNGTADGRYVAVNSVDNPWYNPS